MVTDCVNICCNKLQRVIQEHEQKNDTGEQNKNCSIELHHFNNLNIDTNIEEFLNVTSQLTVPVKSQTLTYVKI